MYGIQPGDKLYLVNTLEHKNGQVVSGKIPLANILSEAYKAELKAPFPISGTRGTRPSASSSNSASGLLGGDPSMNPDDYIPGRQTMIPLLVHHDNCDDLATLENVRHRTFAFGRSGTDASPWTIKADDGLLAAPAVAHNMDPRRIMATPQLSTGPTQAGYSDEVPRRSGRSKRVRLGPSGPRPLRGRCHSLPRRSPEDPGTCLRNRQDNLRPQRSAGVGEVGPQDMYRIGPDADSRSPITWPSGPEFAGTYVEHCHNTQHEDHAMLLRWDVEHPDNSRRCRPPATWDGVEYVDSARFRPSEPFSFTGVPSTTWPPHHVVCAATIIGVRPGPFEYMFQERKKGEPWSLAQAWSANDNLHGRQRVYIGAYEMKVSVREVGRTSLLGMATMPFTVASTAATGATLTPSLASPQAPGASVTWTAAAGGGSGSYEYKIQLYSPPPETGLP